MAAVVVTALRIATGLEKVDAGATLNVDVVMLGAATELATILVADVTGLDDTTLDDTTVGALIAACAAVTMAAPWTEGARAALAAVALLSKLCWVAKRLIGSDCNPRSLAKCTSAIIAA